MFLLKVNFISDSTELGLYFSDTAPEKLVKEDKLPEQFSMENEVCSDLLCWILSDEKRCVYYLSSKPSISVEGMWPLKFYMLLV